MSYIRIVIGLLLFVSGAFAGHYISERKVHLRITGYRYQSEKYLTWVRMYDLWLMNIQNQKKIDEYLLNKGIYRIAIYGMSYLGTRLFYELKDSLVKVVCGLDKNSDIRVVGLDVKKPDCAETEEIDAVIVTALFTYDEIEKNLKKVGYKKIIAFDELLYELMKSQES